MPENEYPTLTFTYRKILYNTILNMFIHYIKTNIENN